MSSRAREIELLILAIYSALPLYANQALSAPAVAVFQLALGVITMIVASGRTADAPRGLLRTLAIAYLIFFPFDAVVLSRGLISASGHLVFFIAVYQAIDATAARRLGQRMVVILLIFVTSVATSTHLSIVFFVVGFAYLAFRQLIRLSLLLSAEDVGESLRERTISLRPAWIYLLPSVCIGIAIFPSLPRLHNPLVRGMTGAIEGASTGLSDAIDFSMSRSISSDPTIVARIWMPRDAVPFFTPLRLRGSVYDAYRDGQWRASRNNFMVMHADDSIIELARPVGFTREIAVQQNIGRDRRLLLPVGTYAVTGLPQIIEGPRPSIYILPWGTSGSVSYKARLSRYIQPLKVPKPSPIEYPVTPRVEALAREIVGTETDPELMGKKIEDYLVTNFQYVPDPSELGRPVSIDQFLLEVKRGHCEYFAAGMVVLLKAVGVQSRIVGGFYGGKLNPLTGYFTVARSDAHAWVEAYNGARWTTFDPTPPSLRPGNQQQGLIRAYAAAVADSINYFWDRYILTYGLSDQIALAMQLLDRTIEGWQSLRVTSRALGIRLFTLPALYSVVLLILVATAIVRFVRSRRPAYAQMLDALDRRGFEIDAATAPLELLERVRRERPELAHDAEAIVAVYLRERFDRESRPDTKRQAASRAALRRILRAI